MSRPSRALIYLWAVAAPSATLYAVLSLRLRLDHHPPSNAFNLAMSLGEHAVGLAIFVALMAALGALYLTGLACARRLRGSVAVHALALGGVFAAILLPAHPFYSADILHYAATARVLYRHHHNPLVTPPAAFPDDPVAALADWRDLPSPYGPVWTVAGAVPFYATDGMAGTTPIVVGFKALAAAALLGAAWLAGAVAERLRPGSRTLAVVMLAWNPLALLHVTADGHNDAVLLLLLLLGVWLWVQGRVLLGAWAVTAATLVKFVPLVLMPVFVVWLLGSHRPHRRREAALIAATVPLLVVAAYLPFWHGRETLHASLGEGRYLTTSLHAALLPGLARLTGDDAARWTLTAGARLMFVPVLAWLAWRGRRDDPEQAVARSAAASVLYLVLATPWFMPWYALWPLALAAAVPRRSAVAAPVVTLTLGALLLPVATNFLTAMSGQGDAWPPMHAVAAALAFGPVAVVAAVMHRRSPRSRLPAAAPESFAPPHRAAAGPSGEAAGPAPIENTWDFRRHAATVRPGNAAKGDRGTAAAD